MSACTGKCCAVFNYPTPPETLAKRTDDADALFLADMLVPLTTDEALARAERFGVTPPAGIDLVRWATQSDIYTCRHWDEETKLCGVYEERPMMCRGYPYVGKCQHDCKCEFRSEPNIRTKWAAIQVRGAAA